MYIGLHVKYPLFLSDFNGTWIFSTDFRKKSSDIKFNENPPNGSRVVPCGRTDGQTDKQFNSRFTKIKLISSPFPIYFSFPTQSIVSFFNRHRRKIELKFNLLYQSVPLSLPFIQSINHLIKPMCRVICLQAPGRRFCTAKMTIIATNQA